MPFFNKRQFIFHTIRQVYQMLTHGRSIGSWDINGPVLLFMAYYFTIQFEFSIQLFNYLNVFFFSKSHCTLNNFIIFLLRSIISNPITQTYGGQIISNQTIFICFFAIANKQIVNFVKCGVSNSSKAITFNYTSGVSAFSNFWDIPIRFFIASPAFVKFKLMVQVVLVDSTLLQLYFRAFSFSCILASISQSVTYCHLKKIRGELSCILSIYCGTFPIQKTMLFTRSDCIIKNCTFSIKSKKYTVYKCFIVKEVGRSWKDYCW